MSLAPLFRTLIVALAASIMSTATLRAADAPWVPDLGNGTYRNPVLFADYSDPDVVRVGDDFWLTASSFSHAPGLPILHSRDLVNWTIVNHALPALSYPTPAEPTGNVAEHFSVPRHGAGVWAPSIRHHGGKFWIYFPDPDYGIYVTTATDPRGAWSAPVLVKGGRGLIDPCPLWDDDGKVYLVHGWAKSRSGKNNLLTLNELAADGARVVDGEGKVIIDENTSGRGFGTLEGPKFYKHGGEYFIFAPVGGVANGSQAVYRAKDILGPYAARIVLAQGATPTNGPHQGGWVDTPSGENWFMHFQDRGPYGRIVHLEPMAWRNDGWPTMGTGVAAGAEKGEPVLTHKKPTTKPQKIAVPATSDEFDAPQLGLQWQWQANPRPDFFSLTAHRGSLRLNCRPTPAASAFYNAPHLLLQKFPAEEFTVTTRLDFAAGSGTDTAGLIVFGDDYAWIGVRAVPGGRYGIVRGSGFDRDNLLGSATDSYTAKKGPIYLRVTVRAGARCQFAWSVDGITFTPVGDELKAKGARWVGAKVGVFATRDSNATVAPSAASAQQGHFDFDWFRVTR